MGAATIIALLQAALPLLADVPQFVEGAKTAIALFNSGTDPTPEQQAQIDAALDAAHAALQAAQPAAS